MPRLLLSMLFVVGISVGLLPGQAASQSNIQIHQQRDWNAAGEDELRQAARNGNADAMFTLAVRLEMGRGIEKNDREAAQLYDKLVQKGHVGAMINLAALYMDGRGVPQDPRRSATLYKQAADAGSASAKNTLGYLYFTGNGVPQDFDVARRLFEEAARSDVPYAFASLGVMYATGSGVPQSNIEAYAWFAVGEAAGDPFARENRLKVESSLSRTDEARAKDRARELLKKFGKAESKSR